MLIYGIRQNYSKAKDLFLKACNGGNTDGCYNLGVIYYDGNKVKQNYLKGKVLFFIFDKLLK